MTYNCSYNASPPLYIFWILQCEMMVMLNLSLAMILI
jgi:hypothetical protein